MYLYAGYDNELISVDKHFFKTTKEIPKYCLCVEMYNFQKSLLTI